MFSLILMLYIVPALYTLISGNLNIQEEEDDLEGDIEE
jgi:hypothetical protein